MTAETFFSEREVAAYHLAHDGKIAALLKAVEAGLDVNRPGKEDMTMLGLAVLNADRQAIATLMRAGADANQVIPDAGSPAILAISKHYNPPRTEAIAALLDGGYDPNQFVEEGTPYLFFFVSYSHWPGLNLALQRGGSINARRDNGKSLLTYLVERGCLSQAHTLITAGADVAASSNRGGTPLLAIESRLRRGDPSIRDVWKEMIETRELILSKLSDPKDRHTVFTDITEKKIRENPL